MQDCGMSERYKMLKLSLGVVAVLSVWTSCVFADVPSTAVLNWTLPDGTVVSEELELLPSAVARIKEGCDAWQKVKHLQLEFVESHEEVAPGVFRTGYSNGASVTVDYNRGEWRLHGS